MGSYDGNVHDISDNIMKENSSAHILKYIIELDPNHPFDGIMESIDDMRHDYMMVLFEPQKLIKLVDIKPANPTFDMNVKQKVDNYIQKHPNTNQSNVPGIKELCVPKRTEKYVQIKQYITFDIKKIKN